MRYYTTGKLSPNIELTPEGYLLCRDVAIARLGAQEYLPEEVSVEPGPDGTVLVQRLAKDVFAPACIASFEGKPVVLDHPAEDVDPASWRSLACGVCMNVRPGQGTRADLLLADLLITDAEAITAVKAGLREVSCGYDAEYAQVSPGVGRQTNIIGNHVALVPQGRCGARCAIRDHYQGGNMTTPRPGNKPGKSGFWDRLLGNPKVRRALDEAAAEESNAPPENKSEDNDPGQQTGQQAAQQATDSDAKLDEILLMVRSIAEALSGGAPGADNAPANDSESGQGNEPAKDNDPEQAADNEPAKDNASASTGDRRVRRVGDADTLSRAKLLAPRLAVRTGDALCAVQRAALREATRDAAIDRTVTALLRGATLATADCLTLDAAFVAASEVARAKANARTADSLTGASTRDARIGQDRPLTPADLNTMYRDHYSRSRKE